MPGSTANRQRRALLQLAVICLSAAVSLRGSELPTVQIGQGTPLGTGIRLNSGWEYHARDGSIDEIRMLPASAWETVRSSFWDSNAEPAQGWTGRGWFRMTLDVAPEAANRPLGLRLWHLGATEVFLDGRKAGGFGKIEPQSYVSWNPQGRPLTLVIPTPGRHQLCIRYVGARVGTGNPGYLSRWWIEESKRASYRVPLGFQATLADADAAFGKAQEDDATTHGFLAVVLTVLASFALVYGLLYALRRQDRLSLYGGLLAFAIAGATLGAYAARNGHFGLESFVLARAANAVLRFSAVCAMVMFLGEAAAAKKRIGMLICIAAAMAVELSRFVPQIRGVYEPGLVSVGLSFAWLSWSLMRSARNRVAEMPTLTVAVISLNIFVWMGIFSFFREFSPAALDMIRAVCYLTFLGTMIVYQARRFAATDHALQQLNEQLEFRVEERTRELAESEQRAQAGNDAKSRFLAMVSHEIRTPMNGVMGLSELLLQERLTPDHRSYVESISTSAKGLLTIVNDLLDVSKIEAGHLALDASPFNLDAVVHESLGIVGSEAAAKGLRLTHQFHGSIPRLVLGDAARIRQILVNLLGNAVKFTSAGSVELLASCEKADGGKLRISLSVKDTGIGMTPEHQANLFRSYYQAAPEALKRGGTGLGLVISKNLAELMGGRIWVESELGRGSTFHCELSLLTAADAVADKQPDTVMAADLQKVTYQILVADDNRINRLVTSKLLESLGHFVEVVENGEEVLSALRRRRYDAILMDVQMPHMDGITATNQIHETYGTARPKIIGLTANAMAADRLACLEAGMDACLAKPIPVQELQAAIASFLP